MHSSVVLTFLCYMHQNFKFFCKYWPDDGLLRLKLVANKRITKKFTYSCVRYCTYLILFPQCTLNTIRCRLPRQCMRVITCFCIMPRLRMSGALPPFRVYAFIVCTGTHLFFSYVIQQQN